MEIPNNYDVVLGDEPTAKYKQGDIVYIPFNGIALKTTITEVLPLKKGSYQYYYTEFTGRNYMTDTMIFPSKEECNRIVRKEFPKYDWGTFTTDFGQFMIGYNEFPLSNKYYVSKVRKDYSDRGSNWEYDKNAKFPMIKRDVIKRFVLDQEEDSGLEFKVLSWLQ